MDFYIQVENAYLYGNHHNEVNIKQRYIKPIAGMPAWDDKTFLESKEDFRSPKAGYILGGNVGFTLTNLNCLQIGNEFGVDYSFHETKNKQEDPLVGVPSNANVILAKTAGPVRQQLGLDKGYVSIFTPREYETKRQYSFHYMPYLKLNNETKIAPILGMQLRATAFKTRDIGDEQTKWKLGYGPYVGLVCACSEKIKLRAFFAYEMYGRLKRQVTGVSDYVDKSVPPNPANNVAGAIENKFDVSKKLRYWHYGLGLEIHM